MKKFDLKSMSVCGWLVALFVIFPVLLVGETLTTGGLVIGCVIALLAVFVAYMGINATGRMAQCSTGASSGADLQGRASACWWLSEVTCSECWTKGGGR